MDYNLEFRSFRNSAKRIIRKDDGYKWEIVTSLQDNSFVIKPYQRGFRWGENNVTKLMEDIDKYSREIKKSFPNLFNNMDDEDLDSCENFDFFCLQTLTVEKTGKNEYELIDGQQRLTSIFLISEMLGLFVDGYDDRTEYPYSIIYERTSEEKKQDITEKIHNIIPYKVDGKTAKKALNEYKIDTLSDLNWFDKYKKLISEKINELHTGGNSAYDVDLYYIENALTAIVDYIKSNKKSDFGQMQECINRNLFFIWYEVNNDDAYKTFSSINSNQIRLTNAELIKSLLLRTGSNCENAALKWETIEQGLCNDDLWAFISGEDKATRMDFVLELYALSNKYVKSNEENALFDWYEQSKIPSEEKMKGIEEKFKRISEWYDDVDIYHLIGLLTKFRELKLGKHSSQEALIIELFDKYDNSKSKKDFVEKLKEKVKKCLLDSVKLDRTTNAQTADDLFDKLSYDDSGDHKTIEAILWTVNVWEIIEASENNNYKKVDSQKIQDSRTPTINTRFPFSLISGSKNKWTLEHIMPQNPEESSSDDEKKKYKDLVKEINENGAVDLILPVADVHNIKNLALLKQDDNSSLGNCNLSEKRESIVKRLGTGSFVPGSTVNAFLLYYNSKSQKNTSGPNSSYWTKENADAYINQITECLNSFGIPEDGE